MRLSTSGLLYFAIAASTGAVRWTDLAIKNLLELLRSRWSLWNIKSESYRDRNEKKTEYTEIFTLMKDEVLGIDLASLKGKLVKYMHEL